MGWGALPNKASTWLSSKNSHTNPSQMAAPQRYSKTKQLSQKAAGRWSSRGLLRVMGFWVLASNIQRDDGYL
jgi:hypothetical protein